MAYLVRRGELGLIGEGQVEVLSQLLMDFLIFNSIFVFFSSYLVFTLGAVAGKGIICLVRYYG